MPACPVCALDRATLDRGICDGCRRDHHVTRTDPDDLELRFGSICTCGWKSDQDDDRDRAVAAARMHRANAQIQTS